MDAPHFDQILRELARLHQTADHATRRLEEAARGGPDWDAAMAELEDVEAAFGRLAPSLGSATAA